jgi:hypothetical protein
MSRRLFLLGLLAAAAVPALARALRAPAPERCALDGVEAGASDRVRVEGAGVFCSVACAEAWLAREPHPRAVFVVDEASGREIPAAAAWFVRSRVVTSPRTGNRIHAFADRGDAERHAEAFQGRLLLGDERPFQRRSR